MTGAPAPAEPALYAQAAINALTLIALLVGYRAAAPLARRSQVVARLRTLYWLLAALTLARLLSLVWPGPPVATVVMLAAAWLPFAGLRLAEELTRRHAWRAVKLATLIGACGFSALAVSLGLIWDRPLIVALALWQSLTVLAMIALLVANRGAVTAEERRACDTLTLALILIAPLALTDFQTLAPDLVVRGGAFALLILLLATSRLAMTRGAPALLLADFAIVGSGGVMFWGTIRLLAPGLDSSATLAISACGLALIATVLLLERFLAIGRERVSLAAALAGAADDAGRRDLLAAHPLLSEGRELAGDALADYPQASLVELARHRVISADTFAGADDALGGEAARDLLIRNEATHLLRLSAAPPRFLAIAGGALAGSAFDADLQLAARLIEDAA